LNFTLLSPLGFSAGLLTLAGGLYLLQRLRVQHRAVEVVTTMFWHEAVQETRARVFVRRFRHPWAYLLILIIAGLIWGAFAAPQSDAQPEEQTVFLLDSSAAMAHGNRFAEARGQLIEQVEQAPLEGRSVLASGGTQRSLLLPGEASLLLESRLAQLTPTASPGQLERTIEAVARRAQVPTRILVFGDAHMDQDRLALLPENIQVERVPVAPDTAVPSQNTGITELGTSLASSGAWDAVDVLVEITTNQASSTVPAFSLDGQALTSVLKLPASTAGVTRYLLQDVSAMGGRFEATLPAGDSLELDDRAALMLPNRPRLKVLLSDSLREILGPVLEADPAVQLVSVAGDICLRRAHEALGSGLPALIFGPAAEQESSFLVRYDSEQTPEEVLSHAMGDLALGEIDATSLAEVAQAPISLGAVPSDLREVLVWEELIGEGFDFVDSRAFPLFVAGSLRWLGNAEALQAWCAAGETRIAGTRFAVAGDNITPNGSALVVSLLSRTSSLTQPQAPDASDSSTSTLDLAGGASDPVTWLLLLATLLLLFEWHQVRTGRMP
jgi:hypothetical protein